MESERPKFLGDSEQNEQFITPIRKGGISVLAIKQTIYEKLVDKQGDRKAKVNATKIVGYMDATGIAIKSPGISRKDIVWYLTSEKVEYILNINLEDRHYPYKYSPFRTLKQLELAQEVLRELKEKNA